MLLKGDAYRRQESFNKVSKVSRGSFQFPKLVGERCQAASPVPVLLQSLALFFCRDNNSFVQVNALDFPKSIQRLSLADLKLIHAVACLWLMIF
jgi:hypothetical protein